MIARAKADKVSFLHDNPGGNFCDVFIATNFPLRILHVWHLIGLRLAQEPTLNRREEKGTVYNPTLPAAYTRTLQESITVCHDWKKHLLFCVLIIYSFRNKSRAKGIMSPSCPASNSIQVIRYIHVVTLPESFPLRLQGKPMETDLNWLGSQRYLTICDDSSEQEKCFPKSVLHV